MGLVHVRPPSPERQTGNPLLPSWGLNRVYSWLPAATIAIFLPLLSGPGPQWRTLSVALGWSAVIAATP